MGNSQFLTDLEDLKTAQRGTTFIVAEDIYPTGRIEPIVFDIAPEVTLIFDGGSISGNCKLVGNQTAIQAPISQIFGEDVVVDGTWLTDRAYPQWFDDTVGKKPHVWYKGSTPLLDFLNSLSDEAPAINKAIKMKKVGEVFLPQGNYYISSPIVMTSGIELVGEGEATYGEWTPNESSELTFNKEGAYSTCIIPFIADPYGDSIDSTLIPNHYLTINLRNENDWQVWFPLPSKVSNIIFHNCVPNIKREPTLLHGQWITGVSSYSNVLKIAQTVFCKVAGGCDFENVTFYSFRSAVQWTDQYADRKTLSGCHFPNLFKDYWEDCQNVKCTWPFIGTSYMVELVGHGDALSICNCHFSESKCPEADNIRAFRLTGCHGGSIRDSIINSDALIESCDAITFDSNHLECGAQLRIISSKVRVCNNWFEKGSRPSVVIDVNYSWSKEDQRYYYGNSSYSTVDMVDNSFRFYNTIEGRPILQGGLACEYDILLKKSLDNSFPSTVAANLHISNCYRFNSLDSTTQQPTGIWLCTEAEGDDEAVLVPISEFNSHSYFLSRESSYLFGGKIVQYENIEENPQISAKCNANNHVPFINDGNIHVKSTYQYKYSIEVLLDAKRRIAIPTELTKINDQFIISQPFYPYLSDSNTATGMLIKLKWGNMQRNYTLVLRRTRYIKLPSSLDTPTYIVEIPVCGSIFLYDNSTSVNGYRWRLIQTTNMEVAPNTCFKSVEFRGNNVICTTDTFPQNLTGQWTKGDIIRVVPEGTSATGEEYIFNGTAWIRMM